ncbi:MAG TPA: amino acid ABC transporter substrate-binding protein [Candidatus Angelobacter sp.]|jgi:branched-chain amino acid transport system substrate-binding protein|nr:amino acid ABC transporter substrate-binding protein [Candidatus Angelobacter sp.]
MTNSFSFCSQVRRFAVCALLLTVFLCASGSASPVADDTISIGVVLPITGREGKPGQFQKEGIELAIKKINDAGGVSVKGKKMLLKEVFYDDGSDSAKSAALAERAMSSDNVTAVLGGYSTALGEAEAVMPDRYQTPWIATGAGATSIFAHGYQYTFGALSPVSLLGSITAEFLGSLVDQGKLKKGLKIALLVENTDHGIDYTNGIQQWIKEHPGYFTVVFNEKFELGGTDFSPQLQKVKSARADIFLGDAHLQDYITMHRQYLQSGMHHQMISYGARGPEAAARTALGDGINYIFSGIWWADKLSYPQVQQFIKDYKAFTGRDPDSWYAATAYDAMRILAQAISQAGSTDRTKVRDALRKTTLKDSLLPSGVLKFGTNGQAGYPFVIVQNQPGSKREIVYPKNMATGTAIAPTP